MSGLNLPDFSTQADEAAAEAAAPQLVPGSYLGSVTKVSEHRSDEAKPGNDFPAIGLYIELLVCRDPKAIQNGWNRDAGSMELKRYSWAGYYNPASPDTIIPPHQKNKDGSPLRPGIYRDLAALGQVDDQIDYAALRGRLVTVQVGVRQGTGQWEGREFSEVKGLYPFFADSNDPSSIAPMLADLADQQHGPDAGPAF